MTLSEAFAVNLKKQRSKQQLSQETLAARAHLSISHISMLERGLRAPPLDTLETLADALGVKPLALFAGA